MLKRLPRFHAPTQVRLALAEVHFCKHFLATIKHIIDYPAH
jgi:hypothetical protein